MNVSKISLSDDRYFIMIKNIIERVFHGHVEIILFGSRARGVYDDNSDYDICIKHGENDNASLIAMVRDILDNSNIPYKVDIIDYFSASDLLKEQIMKEGIIWKN